LECKLITRAANQASKQATSEKLHHAAAAAATVVVVVVVVGFAHSSQF